MKSEQKDEILHTQLDIAYLCYSRNMRLQDRT